MSLRLADSAGIVSRVRDSQWRRDRLLILCYHGVSLADEHEWSDLHVSEEHLRRRFETLRRGNFRVLPLAEALERLYAGTLPPRSVALTFDDGLYDFAARAYPLLREYGFHATLYVTTFYCLHRAPVFDVVCSYLLWKGRGKRIRVGSLLADSPAIVVPTDAAERRALLLRIRAHASEIGFSAEEKNELARALSADVGVDWDELVAGRLLQLMTPDEVASLSREHVDVQLHTHRHRTPRDRALFERELDDNRAALADMGWSPKERQHFCYPSGDYDQRFFPWLREKAVVSATTCTPRIATRACDPLLLPRVIDTMAMTDVEFHGWLSGISDLLPRRRRR